MTEAATLNKKKIVVDADKFNDILLQIDRIYANVKALRETKK